MENDNPYQTLALSALSALPALAAVAAARAAPGRVSLRVVREGRAARRAPQG